MKKTRLVFAVCWAAALFLSGAIARGAERPSACVACHTFMGGPLAKPVEEWNGSVHKQNGITCDLCHGGDASVDVGNVRALAGEGFADRMSRAMSKDKGFIGKPSGKAMFAMCAQCHRASVDRYEGSIMGKLYLDGKGGPSCVACHNAHNNVIPAVPKVCEQCHKDTTGFDRIDPMNVTDATVGELSRIRIGAAEAKAQGAKPPLAPAVPEDLDPYQVGLLAFGAVAVMLAASYLISRALERRKKP